MVVVDPGAAVVVVVLVVDVVVVVVVVGSVQPLFASVHLFDAATHVHLHDPAHGAIVVVVPVPVAPSFRSTDIIIQRSD